MNKYTPNGISLDQIKKYAKKMKKEKSISLNEAMDLVTEDKTNIPTWKAMIKELNKKGGSIAKIKIEECDHVIYGNKNILGVPSEPGHSMVLHLSEFLNDNKLYKIAKIEGGRRVFPDFEDYFSNVYALIENIHIYDAVILKSINNFKKDDIERLIKEAKIQGIPIFAIYYILEKNTEFNSFFSDNLSTIKIELSHRTVRGISEFFLIYDSCGYYLPNKK